MKREHPAVIKQAMGDAVRYYWEPSLIPTLHKLPIVRRSSKLTPAQCSQVEFHHNRSERRHAQVRVIQALIARLDLATLKIGTPLPDGTFLYRSFEEVWKLTDISYSRFKRSIADLKAANLLEVTEVKVKNNEGEIRSRPAIKKISRELLLLLGISEKSLESARSYAREKYERIKKNNEAKMAKRASNRSLAGPIANSLHTRSHSSSASKSHPSAEYLRALWMADQVKSDPSVDLHSLRHKAFLKYPG